MQIVAAIATVTGYNIQAAAAEPRHTKAAE